MTPRRVLHLLPFPPRLDASHGGGRVSAELVTRIARAGHPTAVAHLWSRTEEPELDDEVRSACETVLAVPRQPARRRSHVRVLVDGARAVPRWVGETFVPDFAEQLAELADSWRPDLVYVQFQVMGQYVGALPAVRRQVLIPHEPGSPRAEDDARRQTRVARRAAALLELSAWRRFERKLLRSVDAVVVFTEADRRSLLALEDARIEVIPFGTVVPEDVGDAVGVPGRIVFVGNFTHRPNVEAAAALARQILPRVRADVPDAHLVLVGSAPPPEIRSLAGDGVILQVDVDTVAPHLASAAVVAVPVRTGAGMRVKVLEALAAGKAVVTTARGVEGMPVEPGRQFVGAETDAQFARAIAKLLNDPHRRRELGAAAHEWARRAGAWDAIVARYEALQEELLRG